MAKEKNQSSDAETSTPVVEAAKVKPAPFTVAEGCSIVCRKGMLAPGDEVKAAYLADGDAGIKSLDDLVKAGKVTKN